MAKRFFAVFSLTFAVIMVSVFALTAIPNNKVATNNPEDERRRVITVAERKAGIPDENKVLESRFLNMLNHNYVYDEAFYTVEDIVNESVTALIDMREGEDSSYIAESFVADYVLNMYGIEIEDFSEINPDFPKKEGFVYILPRGYSDYNHEITSVAQNEDGSYTVKTKVIISSHDSGAEIETCETLFVPNEMSQFGFSIINSKIGAPAVAM